MKIAIQGHPFRGKEVIQILESLGGIDTDTLKGTYTTFYYIDDKNEICDDHKENFPPTYKLYTLNEFEKEFPFKIGDIVLIKGVNKPYEVIALEWYMNKLCYKLDNELHYAPGTLTTYEKMKEKRNITLTLEKAREWYKKGGELKEIALQAFSEKELNPLPRSWEEFCEKYPVKKGECILESKDVITVVPCDCSNRIYKNWFLSKKSVEAHLAMIQLEQLRNCWWNDWEPKYDCGTKYIIKWDKDDLIVATSGRIRAFLIFPTREIAEEFLKCFRDLIEKAGDLI